MAPVDPSTQAWLSRATFTPIHEAWLPERAEELAARFRSLMVARSRNVLLLNATMGLQLYPSVVDFFALLQRVHPSVRVTSASHFAEIFELEREVTAKGLHVVPMSEVDRWGEVDFSRFDVVIAVGPSQTLARLMAMPGLLAKLVCLDLSFYHQLIASSEGAFKRSENVPLAPREEQKNRVIGYSCQPEFKVTSDLRNAGFAVERFGWRWFDYIPVGFSYGRYYRADTHAFDVALLGDSGRDYSAIDPIAFRGRRMLFLGTIERAPALERMRAELDLTVVSRVSEDTYARLLALCRCVVLPMQAPILHGGWNVLLSVSDSLATGTPLVTTKHAGIARLRKSRAPITVVDPLEGRPSLLSRLLRRRTRVSTGVDKVLRNEAKRRASPTARSPFRGRAWTSTRSSSGSSSSR